MVGPVIAEGRDERADHDERDEAADSAGKKKLAATDAVEEEDGREGENRVDDAFKPSRVDSQHRDHPYRCPDLPYTPVATRLDVFGSRPNCAKTASERRQHPVRAIVESVHALVGA